MIYNNIFYGLIIFFLIGAMLSIVFNKKDRLATYCSFLSAVGASVFGIIFSLSVIFGETFSLSLSGSSFLKFGFFVDRLSAFFILVISVAVFAVSIYSIGYMREYYGKKNIGYLGFLYNIFILSMILVVSANNAIMFLIVWQLMSVISFFLVIFEHEKPETRKAGIVPLHIWLPYAHPAAPSNVSALMSGVMIKTRYTCSYASSLISLAQESYGGDSLCSR